MKEEMDIRTRIHNEALEAWTKAGYKGTIEAVTGIGKSWIGLKAIPVLSAYLGRKISVLFMAERVNRKEVLITELRKINEVLGIDIKKYVTTFNFITYQSMYKEKNQVWDLVIADEIHDSLTPEYHKSYANNTFKFIIGLSATIDRETVYWDIKEKATGVDDLENIEVEQFTKGDLIDRYAPVCFTYDLNQSRADGTSRQSDLYVIYTHLDNTQNIVPAGTQKNRFYVTEQRSYSYWNQQLKLAMIQNRSDFRAMASRKKIIQNSLEKAQVLKDLIQYFEGRKLKNIVFAKTLNSISDICRVVSYKTKKNNQETIDKFDKGEILTLGSCDILKQGSNISGLDTCILFTYDSKSKGFIQSVGRLRQEGNKLGHIIVLVTKDTKEMSWFTTMIKDFNIKPIYCSDFIEFKRKWEERNLVQN